MESEPFQHCTNTFTENENKEKTQKGLTSYDYNKFTYWCIKLWNNPDSMHSSIFNYRADIFFSVDMSFVVESSLQKNEKYLFRKNKSKKYIEWMIKNMNGWRHGWMKEWMKKGWSLIEPVTGWEQVDWLHTYNVLAPVVPGNVGWCNIVDKSLSTEIFSGQWCYPP